MLPLKRKSLENDPNPGIKKRPNLSSVHLASSSHENVSAAPEPGRYFMVQWRKPQTKKHKTWDEDGVLFVSASRYVLRDLQGKTLSSGIPGKRTFEVDEELHLGEKEVLIDREIDEAAANRGCPTGSNFKNAAPRVQLEPVALMQPVHRPHPSNKLKPPINAGPKFKSPFSTSKTLQHSDNLTRFSAPGPSKVVPIPPKARSHGKHAKSYWTVTWRKPQGKKNKSWDGDGFLVHEGTNLTLMIGKQRTFDSSTWSGEPLFTGMNLTVGGREVEVGDSVSEMEYSTGHLDPLNAPIPSERLKPMLKPFRPLETKYGGGISNRDDEKVKAGQPRHNPDAKGAVVMPEPDSFHQSQHNKRGLPIVPVVVDPILAAKLRPHQVEGVKFLYQCAMGMRDHEGYGGILADEMGLGKTLQTIALIWTLLTQNPYGGVSPVVGKAMVVCPVSLIKNWKNEFHKWLGRDRIKVCSGDVDKDKIKWFMHSKDQVLLIGYEKLRSVVNDLAGCQPPIGLIICDEGHRLKSANSKTTKIFDQLKAQRRIILSGTPIQNDLSEFHSMVDFCNPGLLGTYKSFQKLFENPILRSRDPGCPKKARAEGVSRSEDLNKLSQSFVLRRTADILRGYLPPKHEYVVFIKPTALQVAVFNAVLKPDIVDDVVRGSMAKSLALITLLGKVCTSPMLLHKNQGSRPSDSSLSSLENALSLLPNTTERTDFSLSGKLTFLGQFLDALMRYTDEKCILVSHYTSTLDILEEYSKKRRFRYFRLDGSTKVDLRQTYVDDFNRASQSNGFLFLLSAKAGGVGLNLIGASRLVLIDSDWNPAHDLQAMARIHRDGQKKPVFIYRLLTAGAIEEKIYQRQVTKLGLSDSLMGHASSNAKGSSSKDEFTPSQLKDLFTINASTACSTHDLLQCDCSPDGSGVVRGRLSDADLDSDSDEYVPKGFVTASQVDVSRETRKGSKQGLAALQEWKHINCLRASCGDFVKDPIVQRLLHPTAKSLVLEPFGIESEEDDDSDSDLPQTRIPSTFESMLAKFDEEDDPIKHSSEDARIVEGLSGGTITFLFERKSNVVEDEVVDVDKD